MTYKEVYKKDGGEKDSEVNAYTTKYDRTQRDSGRVKESEKHKDTELSNFLQ